MRKGQKHSEEAKRKLSGFNKGKKSPMEGKSHSEDTRRKMSQSLMGRVSPNKGKHLSDETKRKISESVKVAMQTPEVKIKINKFTHKGKHNSPITEFKKGYVSWNKGISMTEKAKEKLSLAKRGKRAGDAHPNWQGGITPENTKIRNGIEFRLWREAVFARDNWTCQKTGIKGCDLVAHHILNFSKYPELRFAIDNGITLSKKAHQEFHKKYGIKNNTREQLNEFLI